jgi:hypothetical protein
MGVHDKITEEFFQSNILWNIYFVLQWWTYVSSRWENSRSSFSRIFFGIYISYCRGEQMGVHDKITEEFFRSYILWNTYFVLQRWKDGSSRWDSRSSFSRIFFGITIFVLQRWTDGSSR